ncbi:MULTISPECIES: MoxR family ATPase [Clostridium]|uniref:MoxR family ATPase n=1 Tax=Clostridium senegalense TaxID=1465809 RepID=A0A6M0H0V9_9CLOT|nr:MULTISPECIES: MoxR family ATPase [Clostridium]NEU03784.1 MoxR family ATPase [Clostridium senegalense]
MDRLDIIDKILTNVNKVIIGKDNEVLDIIKGVLADGHILIEDIPGVGKTTLIKALTKSLGMSYSRIQFTPDLLPSDIIGVSIYNNKINDFEFKKGLVFSNIILGDEINRTTAKTQSALLEAMEEKQVSEGNITYKLDEPFIVMATENPIEYEGTFPLPEAQLDRFMMKVKIGYPMEDDEINILQTYRTSNPLENIEKVVSKEEILRLQEEVKNIKIKKELSEYIVKIVSATRYNKNLILGASVRASLALQRIAQATALMKGRNFVIPEDIKENAKLVLCHRISLTSSSRANKITEEKVIDDILKSIQVPKVISND